MKPPSQKKNKFESSTRKLSTSSDNSNREYDPHKIEDHSGFLLLSVSILITVLSTH